MHAHTHTHTVEGITKSSEPVQIQGGGKKACHPRKVYVCASEQEVQGSFSDTLSAENEITAFKIILLLICPPPPLFI